MANTAEATQVLYSISQVNALTGVPKSTIRFWEKEFEEFLIPLRTTGNQRRYDEKAVSIVQEINQLVNGEGYTLEGARRKMSDNPVQQGSNDNNSGVQLDELAATMSDYLLKRLFERVQEEQAHRRADF
ncbi:MerR family transcriptional regulator [bacterium]|nr:MerR family transcriptional regulator [bacterium]